MFTIHEDRYCFSAAENDATVEIRLRFIKQKGQKASNFASQPQYYTNMYVYLFEITFITA